MKIERSADDVCLAFLLERSIDPDDPVFEGEVVGLVGKGAFVRFGQRGLRGIPRRARPGRLVRAQRAGHRAGVRPPLDPHGRSGARCGGAGRGPARAGRAPAGALSGGAIVQSDRDHRREAVLDPLTGLFNRAALAQRFPHATTPGLGPGRILRPLDHFKLVNDDHGHAVGDAVLKDVASLRKHLRGLDHVYRVGARSSRGPARGGSERPQAATPATASPRPPPDLTPPPPTSTPSTGGRRGALRGQADRAQRRPDRGRGGLGPPAGDRRRPGLS